MNKSSPKVEPASKPYYYILLEWLDQSSPSSETLYGPSSSSISVPAEEPGKLFWDGSLSSIMMVKSEGSIGFYSHNKI